MSRATAVITLAFGLSSIAAAQAPDRASFHLMLGKDTILTERVWRTSTELHGEFADRMRGARLEYVAALTPDASIARCFR